MKTRGSKYFGTALTLAALALALGVSSCGGGGTAGLNDNSQGNLQGNPAGGNTGGGATAQSFFDTKGSTGAFGIPAGMSGTISAGQQVFDASCAGCHGGGLPVLSYAELQTKMAIPPMTGITLTQQELADLTAWLNRNATPPPATGGGGTPPPATGGTGAPPPATGGTGTGTGTGDDDGDDIGDDNGGSDDDSDDSSVGSDDDSAGGDDSSVDGDDSSTGSDDDSAGSDDSSTGSDDSSSDDAGDDASGSDD